MPRMAVLPVVALIACGLLAAPRVLQADPGHRDEPVEAWTNAPGDPAPGPVRAVAGPNLRLLAGYAFDHQGDTRTTASDGVTTQTRQFDGSDGHSASGRLVGTLPLIGWTGLRASAWGGRDQARRSLDGIDPEQSDLDRYGAGAELFVRHPDFGSLAAGAGYDRLEGDSGITADQLTGSAEAQFFFPDLGNGPLDWFARFEFRHREVEGHGQPFDVDADVYHVVGGARWYATPNLALVFTGTWQRVEEEFLAEDDRIGALGFQWLLPVPIGPVSLELSAAGLAGLSEYKEPPFEGDDRLVYGARAGLAFRFFSGATLVDSIRRFD